MIKLVAIGLVDGRPELDLTFSDGNTARWSAAYLIERDTSLTRTLADAEFFRRAFLEGGALAWPNGLELSPAALHEQLSSADLLRKHAA